MSALVYSGAYFPTYAQKNNDFNISYNKRYIRVLCVITCFFLNFFAFNVPKL